MNIEFYTPYRNNSEMLVNHIRNEVLKLSHIYKEISKAEVLLKEDETFYSDENKVCEIKLSVFGDDLFAHSRSTDFEKSADESIKELRKMVYQHAGKLNEPPDVITSTVKV